MEYLKPKNTDNIKSITTKILNTLVDYDSDIVKYNNAVEDFNELGGIEGVSKILGWDESQKSNWSKKIQNVNSIK